MFWFFLFRRAFDALALSLSPSDLSKRRCIFSETEHSTIGWGTTSVFLLWTGKRFDQIIEAERLIRDALIPRVFVAQLEVAVLIDGMNQTCGVDSELGTEIYQMPTGNAGVVVESAGASLDEDKRSQNKRNEYH